MSEADLKFLPDEPYKKTLYIFAYALMFSALAYIALRYALPALLPFLLAWLVATVLQRPVVYAEKKLKIPKKAAAAVLVLVFISTLLGIIFALVSILIRQGAELVSKISGDPAAITGKVDAMFESMGKFLEKFGIEYDGGLPSVISNAAISVISSLASSLTGAAAGFAASLPRVFIFIAALVISSIYFCADYRKISNYILSTAPTRAALVVSTLKKEFGAVMTKYVRSYFLLFLLTLGELFLGLTVIGVDSAFVLAAVIAFVDVLPVLGTGIVLFPWAVVKLITGDVRMGISLLIIYAIVSVVRQVVEPKIVGAGIGLHPAVSLIMMYIGLKAFGIVGLIVMPIVFTIVKNTVISVKKASA